VRGRRELLLADVEAGEHDGLAVNAVRDVDARAQHGYMDDIAGSDRDS
jgi:hypothetical protein